MLNTYKAYGLTLQSEIELPGLPEVHGLPDVTIRYGSLQQANLDYEPNRRGRLLGKIYDQLEFLVENGDTITVDVTEGVDETQVRTYVLGVLMCILLRQRGLLVLHACSLTRDGQAVAFLGESGWGKSTIAEYLTANGYSLLADDIIALRVTGDGPPLVVPGYPHIRLHRDSGAHLRADFDSLPTVNTLVDKRLRFVETFSSEPVPLSRIFILEKDFRDETYAAPLDSTAAVFRLMAHARVKHLFKDADSRSEQLQQCADLVRRVPTLQLQRKKSIAALSEVLDIVESELASAAAVA